MADHGKVEYGVATGNDLAAHEETYEGFVQLAYIGTLHVINIALGLCIGGVLGNWLGAVIIFVLASVLAAHGLATGARAPMAVMVAISLLTLAMSV
jgi:hypothetical protein